MSKNNNAINDIINAFKLVAKQILASTTASLPLNIVELLDEISRSRTTVDAKIKNAYDSLKETTVLVNELENIINEKTEKVAKLQEQFETYSKLAEIEENKARPLLEQVNLSIGRGKWTERWANFIISSITGAVFLIIGILFGDKIKHFFGIQ